MLGWLWCSILCLGLVRPIFVGWVGMLGLNGSEYHLRVFGLYFCRFLVGECVFIDWSRNVVGLG